MKKSEQVSEKTPTANRQYKDTVFRMLFSEKENLLSLYNAVTGSHYQNAEALKIVTLENAIYMGMKNDLAFMLETNIYLYEHQSTINPNIPLRDLIYIGIEYQQYLNDKSLYSSKLQKIPAPKFMVFYNGTDAVDDRVELRLSKAYEHLAGEPDLELKVLMLNVNEGHNKELMEQCQRYYANILTPFSPLVTAKIKEVLGFNLPVSMVATSHGIVWREDPTQIILKYLEWADHYQEDRITLFYDSMSNNTRMMADAIAQGIHEVDPGVAVKIYNVARHDKNEILTQVFRSKGILVGSSTMNNVMMPKVAGMLEEITGLRFRNKRASAFGSYGWTGGAVDRIQTRLMDAGFDISISLKAKWRPDGSALAECREHGRQLARQWALHPLDAPRPITTTQTTVTPVPAMPAVEPQAAAAAAEWDDDQAMLCTVCQWVYDPAQGEPDQLVAPGTPWAQVPDSFLCPGCGIGKEVFEPCAVEACV